MSNKKKQTSTGGGSIRKRSDGVWEGRYTLKYDPKSGKQVQKSVYGRTQNEVRQKLCKIVNEIDEGRHVDPSRMLLSSWLDTWLNEYSNDKKYSTLRGYRSTCETHIKPLLGHIKLSQLNPMIVQQFFNSLSVDDDHSRALAPKTIKNIHGVLCKALNQATKNGLIKTNPCEGAVLPKVSKPEINPLTDEQVKELFLLADQDEVYGILLKLIVLTGLRESEAMGLTWDCVDFSRGTLKISKQLLKRSKSAGGFTFSTPKSGKTRILRPAPYVMHLLQLRKEQQELHRQNAQEAWEPWHDQKIKGDLVFTTLTGSNLCPQTVYNHFKVIAAKMDIPKARVHDLRHTFAVLSLENGDDIKTVQGNLGHSTAAFTLDVYGHVSESMQRASSNRMEQYVQSIMLL